ncbi:MAG: hypothetical protein WAM39_31670 [Bryobacteraceae bacterium]
MPRLSHLLIAVSPQQPVSQCCTTIPSMELQDQLFRNVYRVLRPPAVFFGTDSTDGWLMRLIHIGDTMILFDPNTLTARLQSCGFENVAVKSTGKMLRFRAYRNQ